MPKNKKKKPAKKRKWRLKWQAIFLIVVIVIFLTAVLLNSYYKQRFFPGIKIANASVGGKTTEQAKNILQDKIDKINKQGLIFVYQNHKTNITPIISSSAGPDLSYKIIEFNIDLTLQKTFSFGREDTIFNNFKRIVRAITQSKNFEIDYRLNEPELTTILQENFQQFEKTPKNAQLEITDSNINVIEEKNGLIFNYNHLINEAEKNIAGLATTPITLKLNSRSPQISKDDAEKNISWIQKILSLAPINLKYDEKSWALEYDDLASYLELQVNQDTSIYEIGRIIPGLKYEEFDELLESISEEINIEAKDAKFEIINGRVAQFQASSQGLDLDKEASYKKISQAITFEKASEIDLIVKVLPADITTENVNALGVKELIGTGKSDFSGSPVNRRHNIAVGADSLNGLLIKPDETFSLLKALGEIDDEHGYKAELVIKGNKTIPEFGGGLCQIGTTTFRVALNAGLPIIERQNHSYRVSYYEPAGTDATIYDPNPDFKFKNDTSHHLLFLTRIEDDELIFELWGTKDGRQIKQFPDPPKIYSIKSPPPTKIVETEDLPVGQKKCTERAHNGATAEFTYEVTYPGGRVETELFESVYVPWQAVCLLGVEKIEEELEPEEPVESETISEESVDEVVNTNVDVQ